jgi:hypothetical protein
MGSSTKLWEQNARAHAKRLGGRLRQVKDNLVPLGMKRVFTGPDGIKVETDTWREMAERLEKLAPVKQQPKTEVWYCWKEYLSVESTIEGEPAEPASLLTPWSDPDRYEYPADMLFKTQKEAKEWKAEFAPDEDWYLVKETLVVVGHYPIAITVRKKRGK